MQKNLQIALLTLLAVALFGPLVAVEAVAQAPMPVSADSSRSLRAARSAQATFERIRRSHLPWTDDRGGSGGACEERIGRFRIWSSEGSARREPPPEPDQVGRARAELIARLDEAAAEFPGDEWVAGQRVRYLIEDERHDEAVAAARACRAGRGWWCLTLEGFALHRRGDFAAADSVFTLALQRMPEAERRRWNDLSLLLSMGDLRLYRRLSDAEREAFEERFWWMAKPLYLLPGNDARSEHYSRHVVDRLQDRSKSPDNLPWGSDLREILLRYGAPVAWERIRPRTLGMQSDGMITHYARGSRSFLPQARFVADSGALANAEWELEARCARASYAPAYTAEFSELEHQIGVFTRGDSVVVVASFDTRNDTLFAGVTQLDAAFFVLRDLHEVPATVRRVIDGGAGSFDLTTLPGPALVSLEVRAADARRAARARYGRMLTATPAHGVALSDLLVLGPSDRLPGSLAEATATALGSLRLRSGARVVLFWEVYGVEARESFDVSIVLVSDSRNLLRRLSERIGIVRRLSPVRVRWQEASPDGDPILPRTLELELPEVAPGSYRIELTLTLPGREPLTTTRAIQIIP